MLKVFKPVEAISKNINAVVVFNVFNKHFSLVLPKKALPYFV